MSSACGRRSVVHACSYTTTTHYTVVASTAVLYTTALQAFFYTHPSCGRSPQARWGRAGRRTCRGARSQLPPAPQCRAQTGGAGSAPLQPCIAYTKESGPHGCEPRSSNTCTTSTSFPLALDPGTCPCALRTQPYTFSACALGLDVYIMTLTHTH